MNSVEGGIENILGSEEQWPLKLFTIYTEPNCGQNNEQQNIQNELSNEQKFDHTEDFLNEIGTIEQGKLYDATIINPNEAKNSNEKQK